NIIDRQLTFGSAHDIRVAKDGSVYVAGYNASPQRGVFHYDANFNLIGSGALIPGGDVQGGHALNHPAGLAIDSGGNLWVGNSDTNNPNSFIREYSPTGVFIKQVVNPTSGPRPTSSTAPSGSTLATTATCSPRSTAAIASPRSTPPRWR